MDAIAKSLVFLLGISPDAVFRPARLGVIHDILCCQFGSDLVARF